MGTNALVILGFSGDLSRRMLLPSLYNLELAGKLDGAMQIIGVSRKPTTNDEVYQKLYDFISSDHAECDEKVLLDLCKRIRIVQADVSQPEGALALKQQLDTHLGDTCITKLFYFAVPPSILQPIIHNLVAADVHKCGGSVSSRLLIEKPFGRDVESAKELSETIRKYFGQESIYLIDHYLAKDTVQNLLHFRFHNLMLQSLWTKKDIKSIQISALESLDVQGRGDFYEQAGALRDMLQSHLMQLLALVTMDEPESLEPQVIRKNRLQILQSVTLAGEPMVTSARGQYDGYKEEVGNNSSAVETFASVKLQINTERWQNIPMYLRAGKAMEEKLTEINITFKGHKGGHEENVLTFRIQPQEGIALRMAVKKPGLSNETEMITLDYCYKNSENEISAGYDRILHDALIGDQTLFPSDEEIMNNWRLFQPILDAWQDNTEGLTVYDKGSKTVESSAKLMAKDDAEWVTHAAWVCSIY